ncbi:MAG: four helix bundle protein [bacterium]
MEWILRMENRKKNKIKNFKNLKIWQKAHKLSLDIAKLAKTFPKDEKYDLVSQMRRSARSIPSDIAEGFGRFHFNDKLTFYERGRSSLLELRNHFEEALGNNYIDKNIFHSFQKRMNEVNFLLNRMIGNVKKARDEYELQKKSKRHSSAKR